MKIITALFAIALLVGCEGNSDSYITPQESDSAYQESDSAYQESDSAYQESDPTYQESDFIEHQALQRPSSGVYDEKFGEQEAIAPLEIKTEAGSDYYVKLESVANRGHTMTMYIHGGDTVSVKVPLGRYLIKYTSGDTWYGEQDNVYFGEEGFFQADESFNFTNTGNQISGYTVTLYQVVNGNLETLPIDKSQF